jgi:hypothetical protein
MADVKKFELSAIANAPSIVHQDKIIGQQCVSDLLHCVKQAEDNLLNDNRC